MITLNDYLYSGDTIMRILQKYGTDLRKEAKKNHNEIDLMHSNFLLQIQEMLEHNHFLTEQSGKIREFFYYMVDQYPYLAFYFRGRIKSLIRAEEKFNAYVMLYIHDYYVEHHTYPSVSELKEKLNFVRDLLAYRIVISLPPCYMKDPEERRQREIELLYAIANELPGFMEERGFTVETSGGVLESTSPLMDDEVRPYYRDYITTNNEFGYQSLHLTLYDNAARCHVEIQLRTKKMDDNAEIGPANHLGYEKRQERDRAKRDEIPEGESIYFDEAYTRSMLLQQLELNKLDVNMFAAANNSLINDGCGLYRGRLILPYEHLSKYQEM